MCKASLYHLYSHQFCSVAQRALLLEVSFQHTYAKSSFVSCSAVLLLGLPHQLLLNLIWQSRFLFSLTSVTVLLLIAALHIGVSHLLRTR